MIVGETILTEKIYAERNKVMSKFVALAFLALAVGLTVLVIRQVLPDMQRYMRIRSM